MERQSPLNVGLVGRGITASESPAIHEREAKAQNLHLNYDLFDFDELGLADSALGDQLRRIMLSGFAGVNVTYPFKQAVIPLLDDIDPTAKALGAVNCVSFQDGRLVGSNSDWNGFDYMMRAHLPAVRCEIVAQIGAGGAGSATGFAMLQRGVKELRIYDISRERIANLTQRLTARFPEASIKPCAVPAETILGADGIVQATPIGMAAHPGMPIDPALLSADQWFAEIIYFPRETDLLREARKRGLKTADGAAMVVGQAAEAFRLFAGRKPDCERMMAQLLENDADTAAVRAESG